MLHSFVAEQRTRSGALKWTIGYYAVIEYLGRKAVLCDFSDITKMKQKEQALAVSASSDPLTGIFNRRKGMELLCSAISGAQESGIPFVLCFLDIDGLKAVNTANLRRRQANHIVCNIIKGVLNDKDITAMEATNLSYFSWTGPRCRQRRILADFQSVDS